jgi:hypothetical protein
MSGDTLIKNTRSAFAVFGAEGGCGCAHDREHIIVFAPRVAEA